MKELKKYGDLDAWLTDGRLRGAVVRPHHVEYALQVHGLPRDLHAGLAAAAHQLREADEVFAPLVRGWLDGRRLE